VAIVMGSKPADEVMKQSAALLKELGLKWR
jgi:phosphoribosylcarboxyaminoimidazole (NCAIR) mutase